MKRTKKTIPPLPDAMMMKNKKSFVRNTKTMAIPNASRNLTTQGIVRQKKDNNRGGGKEGKSWLNKNAEKTFANLINKSFKE